MVPSDKTNQPPISLKLKSPRQPAVKRCGNNHISDMNSSSEPLPTKCTASKPVIPVKKSKKCTTTDDRHIRNSVDTTTSNSFVVNYSLAEIVNSPGSIAAARREQVPVMQVQRKMRIAHYGTSKSANFDSNFVIPTVRGEKRCSFITPNPDPIYVAYHDQEWGVPAQVGSDWTSVLKKRQQFREAFSGFDAETVSRYSKKKITSISRKSGDGCRR